MPSYIDDFQAAPVGAGLPTGWTSRWDGGTWSIIDEGGDRILRENSTLSSRYLASLDAVDAASDRADFDVLTRFRTSATDGVITYLGVAGRASGNGSAETGYALALYVSTMRLGKYVSATFSALATGTASVSVNTWYWCRFRGNSTSLRSKVWAGLESAEPAAWDIDTTDSSITAAGWVGAFSFSSVKNADFSVVAVATGGGVASVAAGGGVNGASAGQLNVTGAALASLSINAASAGQLQVTGAAAASLSVNAASIATLALSGAAAASVSVTAASSATLTVAGASSASLAVTAASTGQLQVTGSATADTTGSINATSSATLSVSGVASAALTNRVGSAAVLSITGEATAQIIVRGSSAAVLAVSGSAAATVGEVAVPVVQASLSSRTTLHMDGAGHRPAQTSSRSRPAQVSTVSRPRQ